MKELEEFMAQLKGRHGPELVVRTDSEPALMQTVVAASHKVGLRWEKTATGVPQSNGSAERAVRALREGTQVLTDESKRALGHEVGLQTELARYMVRYAEWLINNVAKRRFELSLDGSEGYMSVYEA